MPIYGHTHEIWLISAHKGAITYDVSSRGGGGFEMLTVAENGGAGYFTNHMGYIALGKIVSSDIKTL